MRQQKLNDAAKRKKRIFSILVLSLAAVAVLVGAYLIWFDPDKPISEIPGDEPVEVSNPAPEKSIDLSIICVGDVMVHKPQIASQYDSMTGTYNYDNNFDYVSEYIREADLALCNVETTFAGGTPTGYPSFNAPDALADSLANAGFDVGITSNNHLYDKGLDGMKRTLRILRQAGLATSGTKFPWEKNYTIMQVKGLKIAVIAYTYETPSYNGRKTINSAVLSSEAEQLVNSFNYQTLENDLEEIETTINEAKGEGADIIVCYYHWGEEYQRSPNEWQVKMARKTAEMGADIIFASHPHVLQNVEMITVEETGKQVPVFYSLGNFLSNQRAETLNNRYTEQGMIGRVRLEYKQSTGEITEIEADAMRTWLDKYRRTGKDVYAIIPLDESLENNEALQASGHLWRALQASEDVSEVLADSYIWKEGENNDDQY